MKKDVFAKLSETKIEIMKELSKGQRTPSDLSRLLNKSKSTIVEHLDALISAGMVNRMEKPGRKWIFYSLTKDGYEIIRVRPRIPVFVLVGSSLSIISSFLLLGLSRFSIQPKTLMKSDALTAMKTPVSTVPTFIYVSIGLFIVGIVGLFYFYKTKVLK